MRIFISADIEGTAGIAHWDETQNGHADAARFQTQMTREVGAACEGAIQAGAAEILVKDAHDSARNIDPARLPECARVFRGWSRNPYIMMAGMDERFDAALFTGYHSGVGTDGNPLAHTMNRQNTQVLLNGKPCSEWVINAYAAAYLGVPTAFVSGDAQLCAQARAYVPAIVTVPVSEGVGNGSIALHPEVAVRRIREGVSKALTLPKSSLRLVMPDRFVMEICYREHYAAYKNGFYPGAKQTGPYTVQFEATDYMDVLKFVLFAM